MRIVLLALVIIGFIDCRVVNTDEKLMFERDMRGHMNNVADAGNIFQILIFNNCQKVLISYC